MLFCRHTSSSLTERADGSHHSQWLSVVACLHVLCHLENLTGHLRGNTTGSFRNLQTTENITLRIGKGLALLQRDASSQPVPVLADQMRVLEHDLLSVQQARLFPWLECF